jgi:hypothetical protein
LELAKGHAGRQDISGFLEVLFCKIREARGERLWKRTLFCTRILSTLVIVSLCLFSISCLGLSH